MIPEVIHCVKREEGKEELAEAGGLGDSVVVESLCLESESRLESPVPESSPSRKSRVRVESESSPLLIRVKSELSPY